MRKLLLALSALVVVAGVTAYAIACDRSDSKNSSAQASACPMSKGATAAAASECPYHKAEAAKMAGACDAAHKAACAAGKNATASAGGCCSMGAKDASATACVNHVFTVADMHGECCVEKVEQALSHVKGVQAVYVDYPSGKAYVCTGGSKVDTKAALRSLSKAGYKQCAYSGTDKDHCVQKMIEARAAKAKDAGKV